MLSDFYMPIVMLRIVFSVRIVNFAGEMRYCTVLSLASVHFRPPREA